MDDEFKKEVIIKLDKIHDKQNEHTSQLAINTHILNEHHKRATNLEDRFTPIEHDVLFANKVAKVIVAIIATLASLAAMYHYIFY